MVLNPEMRQYADCHEMAWNNCWHPSSTVISTTEDLQSYPSLL